jgi:capsular polysaccharide biosynthesis protein
MANEDEVVSVLQNKGNMMRVNILDLATMTFGDQLRAVRSSNILVGVHGAGLTSIMFAADEAVLVEIHPSYREDRHFRHIARFANKDYLPMRSLQRETCFQTSDNVVVSIPELSASMDGAVRLARNYDSGVSECGLNCSPLILGMDSRLQQFYDDSSIINHSSTVRTSGLDKSFPCAGF